MQGDSNSRTAMKTSLIISNLTVDLDLAKLRVLKSNNMLLKNQNNHFPL